ncbi:MAG: SRPBCC domain-containing protein, partial [Mucilaginibacter sp.]
SAEIVFRSITNDVAKWWGCKDFEGKSIDLYDEFIINHHGAHYSKQKLVEVTPNEKVEWLVTESQLNWLEKNQDEWTNTKMVFEITRQGPKTELRFTHQGLVPEKECYDRCSQGWDLVIKEWLFNFINKGKAL